MAHYSHPEPLPYSNMNHYEEPRHTSASKGCMDDSYMEPYATIGQPMLELESYGDTKATSGDGFIHMIFYYLYFILFIFIIYISYKYKYLLPIM